MSKKKTGGSVILSRECDKAMARSKGLLKNCNNICEFCLCCIEKDINGERSHVEYRKR